MFRVPFCSSSGPGSGAAYPAMTAFYSMSCAEWFYPRSTHSKQKVSSWPVARQCEPATQGSWASPSLHLTLAPSPETPRARQQSRASSGWPGCAAAPPAMTDFEGARNVPDPGQVPFFGVPRRRRACGRVAWLDNYGVPMHNGKMSPDRRCATWCGKIRVERRAQPC